MAGNKKKYLFLFVFILVLVAVGIGYYMYNKPAINVQNTASKKISATDLYAVFRDDSAQAKKNYTNRIIEVSGMVTLITKNQQQQHVVMLKTNLADASINCTMEGIAPGIAAGKMAAVKGICSGMGEGDADIGILGDVYMVRCYHIK